jgi:hypothetical protein
MTTISERLAANRLARMRLGQAVVDIHSIPSNPDVKVALVPLTEADYLNASIAAGEVDFKNDNMMAGAVVQRKHIAEIMFRAMRDPEHIENYAFESIEQMQEFLSVQDLTYLSDQYLLMVDTSSPAIDGFEGEELEEIKKVLLEIDWSALYGRQWFLLKSFLLSLSPQQLRGSSLGFFSTNLQTPTTNSEKSVISAPPS